MATDYTKDIDFIEKRITEQLNHIVEINQNHFIELITFSRYRELVISANSQLKYFNQLKEDYEQSKDKLSTIQK